MFDSAMFFNSWAALFRTLVAGGLAYFTLVVMLRVSGKRTLGKINTFDLVVTVAIGSTLATMLLNKNVSLAEGAAAFFLLISCQYVVTWLSVRTRIVRRIARADPKLLLLRGQFLEKAMRSERVTKFEILQAIRSEGILSVDDVEAVVLETDGSFSVIKQSGHVQHSSLGELKNATAIHADGSSGSC